MNTREFIKKIQNLPLQQRKIIFWIIIIIIGLALLFLWFKITKERVKSFKGEEFMEGFQLPSFEKEMEEIPEMEETLKELEKLKKEIE